MCLSCLTDRFSVDVFRVSPSLTLTLTFFYLLSIPFRLSFLLLASNMMKHGLVTMIRSRYSTQRHAMRIAAVVLLFLVLAFNYDHIVRYTTVLNHTHTHTHTRTHITQPDTTPKSPVLHLPVTCQTNSLTASSRLTRVQPSLNMSSLLELLQRSPGYTS